MLTDGAALDTPGPVTFFLKWESELYLWKTGPPTIYYRWLHRKRTDGERSVEAIRGIEGKRLLYRESVSSRKTRML